MISLGPGDFELVTIKALKALQNCDAICIPTKSSDNSFAKSMTYKIVKELMDEYDFSKEIIPMYTPMKFKVDDWQRQVDIIKEGFSKHETLCFVTLGDSAVYSSVYYLLDLLKLQDKDIYDNCEVVPGITSFSHASAKVKKPLCVGDSGLEIIPLLDYETPKTKVYMRPKIGMDTRSIQDEGDFYTFENLNFKDEKALDYKKQTVEKYMTLFIDFFE